MKYLKKIGLVIAVLLMASPMYIAYNFKYIENWWLWVIIGVLYDIFMYSVLAYINHMEDFKENYPKLLKTYDELKDKNGTKPTYEEKYNALKDLINEDIIKVDIFK